MLQNVVAMIQYIATTTHTLTQHDHINHYIQISC